MTTYRWPPAGSGGGGGGGTPGGTNGQIQYNNAGSFGGDTSTTDGAGNINLTSVTATGNISGDDIAAGDDITAGGDITATGDVLGANIIGQNSGDNCVVLRPGGVQGGVVYNNWTDLYAAIVTLDIAAVEVTFDNSIQPIVIPAGTYNLINVTFAGPIGLAPSNPILVELANGCVFTNFPIVSNLVVLNSVSTTPVYTVPAGTQYLIFIQNAASLTSTTGAPMIQVPTGSVLYLAVQDLCAISGSPGFPLVDLVGTGTLFVFTGAGVNIGGDFLQGGASSIVFYVIENPSVTLDTNQPLFTGNSAIQYAANITNMTTGNGLGDLSYSLATGQGAILNADNSDIKKFLTETSITGVTQAPQWDVISPSDLPAVTSTVVTNVSDNASYFPTMVSTSTTGNYPLDVAAGISFNPSTNKLTTTALNLSGLTASYAVVTDASNNLASLVYTSGVTNTSIVSRDSDGNSAFNNSSVAVEAVVSAGQTVTMSSGNSGRQRITGTSTVTFNLPDATTLRSGWPFYFNNTSTGNVTINQQDGSTLVTTLLPGGVILVVCTSNATVQGTWAVLTFLAVGSVSSTTGTSVPGSLTAATSLISGYTTTATAAGTTTLTVASTQQQYFTGSTTQTVTLPTTGIVAGQFYLIVNLSSGVVTVQSSGANTIQAMLPNTQLMVTALVATPTTAANWNGLYQSTTLTAPVNPTVQKFTASGTYTTPAGVQYIRVRMVGGGGGGGGSGTLPAGNGTSGGATSFGTSLLVANGGNPGQWANFGLTGGTASLGTGPIGIALQGNSGGTPSGGGYSGTGYNDGGAGASSPFLGAGAGGANSAGFNAVANTGSGGGGSGPTNVTNTYGGSGGASGGYVDAIINSPSSSYTVTIGAAGSGGAATANGFIGGNGGSGFVEVTEYYTNLSIGTTTSVAANTVFAGPSSGAAANPTFRALVTADMPASVSASCVSSVTQSIPDNSATAVILGTVRFDTNSAMNTGTGVYTIPVTGKYSVTGCAVVVPNATGIRQTSLVQTGSVSFTFFSPSISGSSVFNSGCIVNGFFNCIAGDTITLFMFQNSGGALNLSGTTGLNYMNIFRVGS